MVCHKEGEGGEVEHQELPVSNVCSQSSECVCFCVLVRVSQIEFEYGF